MAEYTQQDVIQKFMASLDTTTLKGTEALDEAIQACSNFESIQEVIEQMVSDCKNSASADDFLKNYCGIDLSNQDTGAISGLDAGGDTSKNAVDIVPESGELRTDFTDRYFVADGLTFQLVKYNSDYSWTDLEFDSLTTNQKFMWQSLYTWWASGALDLISLSYGDNFGFTENSSATTDVINIGFIENNAGTLAWTVSYYYVNDTTHQSTAWLGFGINMDYYSNVNTENKNGYDPTSGQTYLDRVLAHEFTHAVMSANINYFYALPSLIKEGVAELTHGIDDQRRSDIKTLAGNYSLLEQALSLSSGYKSVSGVHAPDYAGGYMLMRYLAKQSAGGEIGFSVENLDDNVTASGEGGDDTITNSGDNVTIVGGAGDDIIELDKNSKFVVLEYSEGDGNDTVYGYNPTDIVNLIGGSVTGSVVSGNDLTLQFGEGSIKFVDAPSVNVNGKIFNPSPKNGTSDADFIMNFDSNTTLTTYAGNDTISNSGAKVLVDGGAGDDVIFAYGGEQIIKHDEGDGNDIVYGISAKDTLKISGDSYFMATSDSDVIVTIGEESITLKNAADENFTIDFTEKVHGDYIKGTDSRNTLKSSSAGSTIDARGGNDRIINSGDNVTIIGGKGNDTINNSGSSIVYQYANGDGRDLIYGFGENDTLQITSGSIKSSTSSGSDVAFNIGSGAVTLKGLSIDVKYTIIDADGNEILFERPKIIQGTSKAETLTNNLGDGYFINALANNDKIYNYGNYSTIDAGLGNDRIINSGDSVTIIGGGGNDTITNSGNAVVYRYTNGNGKDVITGFGENDTLQIVSGSLKSSAVSGSDLVFNIGNGSINLKELSDDVEYTLVDSGGNKILFEKPKIIQGTSSANTLTNNSDDYQINALAGNDKITNSGDNVTIVGGRGNDTIKNSGDSVVYQYASGDGRDTIYGFGENDTLNITSGSVKNTLTRGDDLVVNIGSGSVVLKNYAGNTAEIFVGSTENISNPSKLVAAQEFFVDDNFITDDAQISDVTEISETNYSVGKIESNFSELEKFYQTVSAYYHQSKK